MESKVNISSEDAFLEQALQKSMQAIKKPTFTPWERVNISRHPERPQSSDYIEHIFEDFIELHGDRAFGDDRAIIAGIAYLGGQKCMILCQEKGKTTEKRIAHNFGMPHPEGYRKAYRLMELAEKFQIPVITLIDTPGAFPGLEAEERGQGMGIAKNLWKMSRLQVPIVSVIIGEGCSGGALGLGVCDTLGMLEHAYYSVISPEGCASILWNDASKSALASSLLKIHAEDLQKMQIVDNIITEPKGGAHKDPHQVFQQTKDFLIKALKDLKKKSVKVLLEERYDKFRKLGAFAEKVELVQDNALS